MMQLMNLPASFEPNRGSGRRWVLLAVNLRAMRLSPSRRGRRTACSFADDERCLGRSESYFVGWVQPTECHQLASVGFTHPTASKPGFSNRLLLLLGARGRGGLLALRPILGA